MPWGFMVFSQVYNEYFSGGRLLGSFVLFGDLKVNKWGPQTSWSTAHLIGVFISFSFMKL